MHGQPDQMPPDLKIAYLWATVFGATGQNGLNGRLKDLERAINDQFKSRDEALKTMASSIHRYDTLETQITLLLRIIQWVGLGLMTFGGLALSGPLADILRGLLVAGGGK